MTSQSFNVRHILIIFTLSTGLTNHVIIIPLLLNASARDAWLAILLSIIPVILWLVVLLVVIKKLGQEKLFDWLKNKYGNIVAIIVMAPFLIYIAFNFYITFRDTVMWIDLSYLLYTPNTIVAFVFLILIFLVAKSGLKPLIMSGVVVLPFVVIFGFFVAGGNMPEKDHSLLFPIVEHGWNPILHGMIYVTGGLAEMIMLLLVQHKVKGQIRFFHLVILSLILIGLTLGPTIGAITEFGPAEAMKQRYPAFEQWRLLTLGEYVDHLDVLSFYQWMSGAFIRLSFLLFLLGDIFLQEKSRHRTKVIAGIALIFIISTYFPISDPMFLNLLMNWFYPIVIGFVLLFTLVLLLLCQFASKKKRGSANENHEQTL
ncbi:endospore germination permease [Bacillus sp. FJAT-45350]|uniref:endospore germination permease n=1 Tax=Bacillus sp. FJAT-45350 TaxID=2011014 RepID=UPI000BB9BA87|nr:endospore germination permease [Bacillus sp. FJAT-45350]